MCSIWLRFLLGQQGFLGQRRGLVRTGFFVKFLLQLKVVRIQTFQCMLVCGLV